MLKISRKNFIKRSLQSSVLIAVPTILSPILESCGEDVTGPGNSNPLPSIQGALSDNKVTISVGTSSPLFNIGSAAIVNYSTGSVLVSHPSENIYNALSSICTHQQCIVTNFDPGSSQFVCPCHGSRYNFNGKVVQGPANTPLSDFPTEFSGDQLTITIN